MCAFNKFPTFIHTVRISQCKYDVPEQQQLKQNSVVQFIAASGVYMLPAFALICQFDVWLNSSLTN